MKIFISKDNSKTPSSKFDLAEKVKLNPIFKTNLKNILSKGLTPLNIEFKKKRKNFSECLLSGIKMLEDFLKNLFRYENTNMNLQIQLDETQNEVINFLKLDKVDKSLIPLSYKLRYSKFIKLEHNWNIPFIFITFLVLNEDKFKFVNFEHLLNI